VRNVRFERADAQIPAFPAAAFDVAISVIEPALMNRAAASALAGVAVSVGGVAGSEAQVLGVVDRLV
jgi:hypothetical protein